MPNFFYKKLEKNKNLMLTSLLNDYATFSCALKKKHTIRLHITCDPQPISSYFIACHSHLPKMLTSYNKGSQLPICPLLCWVCCPSHPDGRLTQHKMQALDHSVVHNKLGPCNAQLLLIQVRNSICNWLLPIMIPKGGRSLYHLHLIKHPWLFCWC